MNEPLRQKKPPLSDERYLARIRELPCCVCGAPPKSDAAHLRMSGASWGYPEKSYTGAGEKPSDNFAVPLCRPSYRPDPVARILEPDKPLKLVDVGCHGRQHGHNQKIIRELMIDPPTDGAKLEEAFWRATGKNPFAIAQVLYAKFGTTLVPRKKKRPRKPHTTIKPKGFAKTSRKIENRSFPKGKRKMR